MLSPSIKHWKTLLIVLIFLQLGLTSVIHISAADETTSRSLQEFIQAQGTFFCNRISFEKSKFCFPIFLAFSDPSNGRIAVVDWGGVEDRWLQKESKGRISLGTQISGSVTERRLSDGRAEITVSLHTTNALTDVELAAPGLIYPCPEATLLFGHRAVEVLVQGKSPALGESEFNIVFINPAPGAPLPDIIQVYFFPSPGQEMRYLAFTSRTDGPLHEAFGVPDGTTGKAAVVQTGLFMTGFKGAVADGFPAERVTLLVTGS